MSRSVPQTSGEQYRVEGHEGIYWVYPADMPTPRSNMMQGAVGIVCHGYHGWSASPVRRGVQVTEWLWGAPTRKQALAGLFAWFAADPASYSVLS